VEGLAPVLLYRPSCPWLLNDSSDLAIEEISSPYDWTLSTRSSGTVTGFEVRLLHDRQHHDPHHHYHHHHHPHHRPRWRRRQRASTLRCCSAPSPFYSTILCISLWLVGRTPALPPHLGRTTTVITAICLSMSAWCVPMVSVLLSHASTARDAVGILHAPPPVHPS
jgi:hypothetical protein